MKTSFFALITILSLMLAPGTAQAKDDRCVPQDPAQSQFGKCNALQGSLEINQTCAAEVDSANPANPTGLFVKRNEEYEITVPGGQKWCDASYTNQPPSGDVGSFFMNLFAWLKKDRSAKWFTMIAEIQGEGVPYDMACSSLLRAGRCGNLLLYANDARGFYWNNKGKILVEIRRVK